MSEMLSIRLQDEVATRLRERAVETSEPVSRVAQRLIDEGLRMAAHPGILFRDGPTGRRAALLRGPDIWEVVTVLRALASSGEAAVTDAAEQLGIHPTAVRTALAYYGEFAEEVDAEVAANERAAEKARASWSRQQRLLDNSAVGD